MAGWGMFQWIAASGMAATALSMLPLIDLAAYMLATGRIPNQSWPLHAKWIEWRERRKQEMVYE